MLMRCIFGSPLYVPLPNEAIEFDVHAIVLACSAAIGHLVTGTDTAAFLSLLKMIAAHAGSTW